MKKDIRCYRCGSNNYTFEYTVPSTFKEGGKIHIYLNRHFFCNSCGKPFFIHYSNVLNLSDYKKCKHEVIEAGTLLQNELLLYLPCKICLTCGVRIVTCMYIKEEIDKYCPNVWANISNIGNLFPYTIELQECKYCLGKEITNKIAENGHANIRALGLCHDQNIELFKYFFNQDNTSEFRKQNNVINDLLVHIYSLEEEKGVLKQILNKRKIQKMKLLRNNMYKEINNKRKLFGEYCRVATNYYREKFGIPLVGERWISETTLFKLLKKLYSENEVIFHAHPKWLNGLELDIYIPEHNLAIEYMGKQHYEPVDFFGGEPTFTQLIERDKRKIDLCKSNGVTLIHYDYRTEVSMDNISKLLKLSKYLEVN